MNTEVFRENQRSPATMQRWPETQGRHAYDWIDPETVLRLALRAYYRLCRKHDLLPDDPTGENCEHLNTRTWFAENLAQDFGDELHNHGFKVGAPEFHSGAAEALALAHGPRSPDRVPPALSGAGPDSGTRRDIHRAQYMMSMGDAANQQVSSAFTARRTCPALALPTLRATTTC